MLSYSWIPEPSGLGSHFFQNILPPSNHQLIFQDSLSFKTTASAAFPPSPARTDHFPLLLPPHVTLSTPILAPPGPWGYYTWCSYNHISTFDISWRATPAVTLASSPSPGTQWPLRIYLQWMTKWSQGLLPLPLCTFHHRLSSDSLCIFPVSHWPCILEQSSPKETWYSLYPKLDIFFIVKSHFPFKEVDGEISGKRRIDSKNSDFQTNTFLTALWIEINLHSIDQNTL